MNNKISKLCTLTSFEDIDQKGILIKELHLQSSYEISRSLVCLSGQRERLACFRALSLAHPPYPRDGCTWQPEELNFIIPWQWKIPVIRELGKSGYLDFPKS